MIVFTHHLKHQLKHHLKHQLIRQREGGRTRHKINHSASGSVRFIVIVWGYYACLWTQYGNIWLYTGTHIHIRPCIPVHTHIIRIYRHINPPPNTTQSRRHFVLVFASFHCVHSLAFIPCIPFVHSFAFRLSISLNSFLCIQSIH